MGLVSEAQAAVVGLKWWCSAFGLKEREGFVVQKEQNSIYLKGSKTRQETESSMKRQKRTEPNPSNFWTIHGSLGAFYTEELSLALLTLLMDVVAPWAYLVQQERRKWSRPEEKLCRKRDGSYGPSRKGGGSGAYQFSADLMPTLKCSLNFSKCQLCKTTVLQLSNSSAVAGSAAFVLFMSFNVTSYNTVRVKRRKSI